MKTLIVFASKHGCAETCAQRLKEALSGEVEMLDLKKRADVSLDPYDAVCIGGSIHAGKVQTSVRKFCAKLLPVLLRKKIGLFLCCMEEGDTARKQFEGAYPAALRSHASVSGMFGGEFNFEKMNFIEKALIKKIAKIDGSVSRINTDAISRFARDLKG